jgi:RNA polymerase sigma-70 factor (ECF subfamily)
MARMITPKLPRLTREMEEALVAQAQNGDHHALEQLLEVHYRQMYHMALKMTRDPVRAQDVTQEACVQALRKVDQFRSEARFASWLCRIVVNTALLRHRREKRLVPTPEIHSPMAAAPEPQPEDRTSDREVLLLTDQFLEDLRDGDRELFVRRFLDGLTLQSIAEETGLSVPAIKSRFHRARLRLKAAAKKNRWGVAA